MSLITVLVAALAFVLGVVCGLFYAVYGMIEKAKTEDLIKGKWIKRKFDVAEMMFGKDEP